MGTSAEFYVIILIHSHFMKTTYINICLILKRLNKKFRTLVNITNLRLSVL